MQQKQEKINFCLPALKTSCRLDFFFVAEKHFALQVSKLKQTEVNFGNQQIIKSKKSSLNFRTKVLYENRHDFLIEVQELKFKGLKI